MVINSIIKVERAAQLACLPRPGSSSSSSSSGSCAHFSIYFLSLSVLIEARTKRATQTHLHGGRAAFIYFFKQTGKSGVSFL